MTDAVLLTRYFYAPADFHEWMLFHLETAGFSRIYLFDNGNTFDIEKESSRYKDKVTYNRIEGHACQAIIYNECMNRMSNADYIMPIDDDEFVEVEGFPGISDALEYYAEKYNFACLGIRWKHLFPVDLKQPRTGAVLDYCTTPNAELTSSFNYFGDRLIKCAIKRNAGEIRFLDSSDPISRKYGGTHVPLVGDSHRATLQDGVVICGQVAKKNTADEHIRLIHCRYKGPQEYAAKCSTWATVSDSVAHPRRYRFDKLYPDLSGGSL